VATDARLSPGIRGQPNGHEHGQSCWERGAVIFTPEGRSKSLEDSQPFNDAKAQIQIVFGLCCVAQYKCNIFQKTMRTLNLFVAWRSSSEPMR
jgi:hypothetical protein